MADPDRCSADRSRPPVRAARRSRSANAWCSRCPLQPLAVTDPVSIESVNRALAADRLVVLCCRTTTRTTRSPSDLKRVGTVGVIRQMAKAQRRHQRHHRRPGARPRRRRSRDGRRRHRARDHAAAGRRPSARSRSTRTSAASSELIERRCRSPTGLSQELRGVVAEHRRPAAARLPARHPARHEAGGQAGAARRGRPARASSQAVADGARRARSRCSS